MKKTSLAAAFVICLALAGCATAEPTRVGASSSAPTTPTLETRTATPGAATSQASGSVTCAYPSDGQKPARPVDPPPTQAPKSGTVTLTLTTNEGPIVITMDRAKTPCTVNSMESLAKQGYFDNTQCHRLVDSRIFVLQCGDPTGTGRGGPGYSFADELTGTEKYTAGTVAMANTGQPGTNGSQFFIVYEDSPLNAAYTLFGTVDAKGLATVKKIAEMGNDGSNPAGGGKPHNDARIDKATLG